MSVEHTASQTESQLQVEQLAASLYNHNHSYIREIATQYATDIDDLTVKTMGVGPFKRVVDARPTYETDQVARTHVENQLLHLVIHAVNLGYEHGVASKQTTIEGES